MSYPHYNGRFDHGRPARRFNPAIIGRETVQEPQRTKFVVLRCRQSGFPQLAFGQTYHGAIETDHLAVCVDPATGLVEKFPFAIFEPCNPDHWSRWPSYLRPLTPVQAAN